MTDQLPDTPEKRREWIKYQLRLRGTSIAQIARDHGVTRQCVINALGHSYPKFERVIAEALERRPEDLWPERYGGDSP